MRQNLVAVNALLLKRLRLQAPVVPEGKEMKRAATQSTSAARG